MTTHICTHAHIVISDRWYFNSQTWWHFFCLSRGWWNNCCCFSSWWDGNSDKWLLLLWETEMKITKMFKMLSNTYHIIRKIVTSVFQIRWLIVTVMTILFLWEIDSLYMSYHATEVTQTCANLLHNDFFRYTTAKKTCSEQQLHRHWNVLLRRSVLFKLKFTIRQGKPITHQLQLMHTDCTNSIFFNSITFNTQSQLAAGYYNFGHPLWVPYIKLFICPIPHLHVWTCSDATKLITEPTCVIHDKNEFNVTMIHMNNLGQ